jgi:hypothetical protein
VYELKLIFESQEELDLFISKYLYCGGEQATGFCKSEELEENTLRMSKIPDSN